MAEKFYVIKKVPCQGCGGHGLYTRWEATGRGTNIPVDYDCQVCRGTGTIDVQIPLEEALAGLNAKEAGLK